MRKGGRILWTRNRSRVNNLGRPGGRGRRRKIPGPGTKKGRTVRTAVLIPAYNCETWIEDLVSRCLTHSPRVLVVDDGSTDRTTSSAWRGGAEVVRHPRNQGKGLALRTGFDLLLREGDWEALVTLDADGQHDPSDIPRLIEAGQEKGVGIVIGSRLAHMMGMKRIRRFFNRLSSRCISGVCKQEIEDTQSGYRLIRADLLRKVCVSGSRYDLEAELLIKASRAGYSIVSIPVSVPQVDGLPTSHYRPFRDSYLIGLQVLRHFLRR
jgi:glycosyltransferase involved in cell wall biosynthesis